MPGSPARNDLTTLLKTTFSAPRISFVDLQLLPFLNSPRVKEVWQACRYTEYPWTPKGVLGWLRTVLYYYTGTARAYVRGRWGKAARHSIKLGGQVFCACGVSPHR